MAAGAPLPEAALTPALNGHAIEVRLYAEDVESGFLPSTGTLRCFEIPSGVRVDSGVESGSAVSPYYDPMIAKVVAHAAGPATTQRRRWRMRCGEPGCTE